MMESEVLGYKSPLYGRRTGEWRLEPFEYTELDNFLPEYSEKDLIRAYAVLGGTPYYLQQFQEEKTLEQNILDNILKPGNVLREEPERLLQQELRQPKNYFSCLKAVLKNRIEPELDQYTSKQFEEICRSYIRKKAEYDKVGSWWYQEQEIDIAAVNTRKNTLLLGECKWTDQKVGEELLEKLKEKAEKVQWENNDREVKYVLFSKNGFKQELEEREAELVTPEKLFN